jgi:hypothetical protein
MNPQGILNLAQTYEGIQAKRALDAARELIMELMEFRDELADCYDDYKLKETVHDIYEALIELKQLIPVWISKLHTRISKAESGIRGRTDVNDIRQQLLMVIEDYNNEQHWANNVGVYR